jgi:hypothetical protein
MIPAGRSRKDFWVSWGSLLFKFQCRMYNQRVFAAFDQDENVSMVTCKNDVHSWTSWCVCKCTDRINPKIYCDPHSLHICRNNVGTQSTEHYKLHLVIFLQKTFPKMLTRNQLILYFCDKSRKRESGRATGLRDWSTPIKPSPCTWLDNIERTEIQLNRATKISELRDENEMFTMWRKNRLQSCHRNAVGVQNHMANEPHRT